MFFLIDGYNLLYAMGLLQRRSGPQVLEKARLRLLGFLHDGHGDDSHRVTVVFDAKQAPAYADAELEYQGIRVLFALAQEQADDLIEEMIRKASVPKKLTVVSDDRRIRTAAQRRHCIAWTCGEYQDHLDRVRRGESQLPVAATDGGKPDNLTQEEMQRWLDEFGGLEGLTD
jgi:predicted RNA-binding protein with PIN domain